MATNVRGIDFSEKSRFRETKKMPVQAPRGQGRVRGMELFSCSGCNIDYHLRRGSKPVCPLCEANRQIEDLREHIATMGREAGLLESDLARAKSETSTFHAMKEGFSLCEPEDVAEIKSIAYRWRDDPTMIVRGVEAGGESKVEVRGLQLEMSDGRVEYFAPTSVGGLIFVESYVELVKSRGTRKAMESYADAVAGKLAQ